MQKKFLFISVSTFILKKHLQPSTSITNRSFIQIIYEKFHKNFLHFITILLCSIFLFLNSNAQEKRIAISSRFIVQSDFQKAEFKDLSILFQYKEHQTTIINWGLDFLLEKKITNRWNIHLGLGYYRNKFNFKRDYDHMLLNIGTDSIPIGKATHDYTFHLLRIPIGITYTLLRKNKYALGICIENVINFSFQQVYNGNLSFLSNPNNKLSKFKYYGNSIVFSIPVSRQLSSNSLLTLSPQVRVHNLYKRQDPILFEYSNKPFSRIFDAIGLTLKYSLILKK